MPTHSVAFWNLENLFDVEGSPRRTDKLQRTIGGELKGWTQDVLDRKLAQLASVVARMNGGQGPDILGVCEVENQYVLDLLCKAVKIPGRQYRVVHSEAQDERGIDVAFVYDRKKFKAEKKFFHFIVKRTATRDIVQVNFRTSAGRPLVLIGNHWPSRSGGRFESEPYRFVAAETLSYFHRRIQEEMGAQTPVLAMGDFNDEPFDRSMAESAQCERQGEKVKRARTACFLNLMWPLAGQASGTHYFDNSPNLLDQFLASRSLLTGEGGLRVLPESVEIVRFPEMVRRGAYPGPVPFGRGASANLNGFSDHFPIHLLLEEA